MDKLTEVTLVPLTSEKYMRPQSMLYMQNGEKKCWDLLCVHQGVFIIIRNVTRNVLIFVRQFRPPVYLESVPKEDRNGKIDTTKYPASLGITLELCAGMVDKDLLTIPEIAAEEVLEECGYKVDPASLEPVCSFPSSVGTTGAKMHLFYCEVTDDMKVGDGGGVHDEIIDVVEMTVEQVKEYMSQKHIISPPSFLFGVQWFLLNKLK